MVDEARRTLDDANASPEDRDEAITKLVKVRLGMPKQKQFQHLMEDAEIRRLVDKRALELHSDQNRMVNQEIRDSLYFAIDEKRHEADLGELGRRTIRPEDPDAFVIPDLASQFADLEGRSDFSDEERLAERQKLQRRFDEQSETIHNIAQLLRAYCLYEKDVQYVIQENKVVIVDEFTGRLMPGRRFSEGLHMALEAKEGVTIEGETQTLATITIQNYFRLYDKLAGMTGTAETEASEFHDIYQLDVLVIPTNRPCVRLDHNDRVYKTQREKYRADHRGNPRLPRARPAGALGHDLGGSVGNPQPDAAAVAHPAQRAQRQVPPAGSGDHQAGRPAWRGHHRYQHGRPRDRHSARCRSQGSWRPARHRQRSPRCPAHRPPASRPLRSPGRSRLLALLRLLRGRLDAAVWL